MKKQLPPIAIFAYNRPKHLEKCLEFIDRSQEFLKEKLPLYIFCDAPKNEKDRIKTQKTIQVAKKYKKAEVIARKHNYGFKNIVEGISQMCDVYGEVIVIEDDILVAPDFLPYMTLALKFYADQSKIFAISGHMYFSSQLQKPEFFFIPYFFCWGWATWKRAWKHYDFEALGYQKIFKNKKNRHRFDCYGSFPFSKMLEKTLLGKCDTWDIQWFYSIFKNNGLVLSPHRSLTWNCGCGGGIHGSEAKDENIFLGNKEYYIHGTDQIDDFMHPRLKDFTFPEKIVPNERAQRLLAITFLQERQRKRKSLRIKIKIWYQKLRALLATR